MEKYKKKFLHIIPNLDFGGAESFLLRLIPHLEGQHLILTLFGTHNDKKRTLPKNASYITIDLFKTSYKDIFYLVRFIFSLTEKDSIFSWLYISDMIGSFIKILVPKKVQLVWNVRNVPLKNGEYSFFTSFSSGFLKKISNFAPDKIIFNSKSAMRSHIINGYPKEKSLVIYNGYERFVKDFSYNNNKNYINLICVARYHPQKNHQLLFESIKEYKLNHSNKFKLHLIGIGLTIENETLITILNKLEIFENVRLYGIMNPNEVHKIISQCDISLLLSKFGESFPNVIAESMLYGTLPIATEVGDSKFIISNHGRCIPINSSPEYISNTIYNLSKLKISNYDGWIIEREKCRKFAENRFNIDKIANQYKII